MKAYIKKQVRKSVSQMARSVLKQSKALDLNPGIVLIHDQQHQENFPDDSSCGTGQDAQETEEEDSLIPPGSPTYSGEKSPFATPLGKKSPAIPPTPSLGKKSPSAIILGKKSLPTFQSTSSSGKMSFLFRRQGRSPCSLILLPLSRIYPPILFP